MQPTAQAVGYCNTKANPAPEGRKSSTLVPNVSFVIRNAVLFQERHKLVLK
jgi:hypothetical protein